MSDLPGDLPPRPDDPELAELFASDPELAALARRVRESRPEPLLDPRFKAVLRARLMRDAQAALAPRRPLFRRRAGHRWLWGTVGTAAALAAAAIVAVTVHLALPTPGHALAVVTTNVGHNPAVDPHQAITVSFNQPMDTQDQTLAAKVTIQPATAFTAAWRDPTTLVVTPLHALATDTVYSVTIPPSAVRSQSGATLSSQVTINFGTAPSPTPGPTATPEPSLQPVAVAQAAPGASVFWDGADTPGITASTAPSANPGSSAGGTASATPGTGQTSSASASASASSPSASASPAAPGATPDAVGGVVVFPASKSPLSMSSTAATAAALSPNGFYLALALTQPDGTSAIVVEQARSSNPAATATTLWPRVAATGAEVTALAWQDSYRIVFVTPQGIEAVNLVGQTAVIAGFPAGAGATGVVLAADGRHAFVPAQDVSAASGSTSPAPSASSTTPASTTSASPGIAASPDAACAGAASGGTTATPTPAATASPASAAAAAPSCSPDDGWLLAIPAGSGAATAAAQLPGSATGVVAFSGDGSRVAWAASGGAKGASILDLATSTPLASPVTVPGRAVPGIETLALSQDGGQVAYSLDPGGLTVATTSGGKVVGTASDQASAIAFSPGGAQLAYVTAGTLKVAPLEPGSIIPVVVSPCAGADQVLNQFVSAQVGDETATIQSLSTPGAAAAAATPANLTRGYVISASCGVAAASGAGPTATPDSSPSATASPSPTQNASPSSGGSASAEVSAATAASLTASARLIVDPSGSSPGQLTDETVLLTDSGGTWLVTALEVPPLRPLGTGPSVLSIGVTPPASGAVNPETVVTVNFDADLQASSVSAGSIQVVGAQGQPLTLAGTPAYDPDTREVTLAVLGSLPTGAEVVVGTSITDIDGGHPAASVSYPVGS